MSPLEITWPYILKTRRENGGAPGVSTESAEPALLHLRLVFGEDVTELPERVLRALLDWSPWTYRWLSWLSRSIAQVEQADGFASLRERLVNPAKFEEACSVLQVADGLGAAAFGVGFDVPVQVGPNTKVPDILVTDSEIGVSFYCEVSTMFSANVQVGQSRLLDAVHAVIIQSAYSVAFSGRFLRPIVDEEIAGLINRIQWEIFEVEKETSFHEIEVGDVLRLALAPITNESRVSAWADGHGLQLNSLSTAPLTIDQGARLRRKIEEEARQLPADQPNLVVIPAQDLLVGTNNPACLVASAKEILSDYRKVAALALVSEGFGQITPSARRIGDDLHAVSDRDGLVHERILGS